jgi:glutaredoxin
VKVNFYTTAGCHLCEEALVLLQILKKLAEDRGESLQICNIDIAESEALMAEYGIRIPVIAADASTGDIGWPFSLEELRHFLNLEAVSGQQR